MSLENQIHIPCSLIIVLTPWKKPLNLGCANAWSLINLTLIVSIGVTAKIASDTPAPAQPNTHSF